MYTYQDFMAEGNREKAISRLIKEHSVSDLVLIAKDADTYNKKQNSTITKYVHYLYTATGQKIPDMTSSNNRLCNGKFPRLNTQRCTYLLGNGITFTDEATKEKLGIKTFDQRMKDATYKALIHGVSFIFFNVDHIHVFPVTEFAPLWDEETGALMAGVRYWQIDSKKPMQAVLYELDGYTRYKADASGSNFEEIKEEGEKTGKKAYVYKTVQAPVDDEPEIVGEEYYTSLPIVPLWGSEKHQSTLVGMKPDLDAFDLIKSGFANDVTDCSEIYWLVNNAGGMDDADLAKFRDRLKLQHIANVDNSDDVSVTPFVQQIPHESRDAILDRLHSDIYSDFGGLDIHTISAGTTNDHIDAAYQPLDEEADALELQLDDTIQQLLSLIGVDDMPIFKRNRISNFKEQTEMVLSAAQYLDERTLLEKLPFINDDEVEQIMQRKEEDQGGQFESDMTADIAEIKAALTAQNGAQDATNNTNEQINTDVE